MSEGGRTAASTSGRSYPGERSWDLDQFRQNGSTVPFSGRDDAQRTRCSSGRCSGVGGRDFGGGHSARASSYKELGWRTTASGEFGRILHERRQRAFSRSGLAARPDLRSMHSAHGRIRRKGWASCANAVTLQERSEPNGELAEAATLPAYWCSVAQKIGDQPRLRKLPSGNVWQSTVINDNAGHREHAFTSVRLRREDRSSLTTAALELTGAMRRSHESSTALAARQGGGAADSG